MTYKLYYLFIAVLLITACSDDDSERVEFITVYSHLDSSEPLVLNSAANLSSYTDLVIDVKDSIEQDVLERSYSKDRTVEYKEKYPDKIL